MIVITNITYVETDRNPASIKLIDSGIAAISDGSKWDKGGAQTEHGGVKEENVKGQIVVNPKTGQEITIGVMVQGQDLLGMYCDEWEHRRKINYASWYDEFWDRYPQHRNLMLGGQTRGQLMDAINTQMEKISEIRTAPFLTRLKWLFTGVKV